MEKTMKAVDQYFEAWNTQDPEARLASVQSAFAPNAVYSDPKAEATGHQAINDMMAAAQAKILENYPSFSFVRTSAIEGHHSRVRFNWALRAPDGTTPVAGVDFADVDDQGRLRVVIGFFGESPAAS